MKQNSKSDSTSESKSCDNNNNDLNLYYKYQAIASLMNQVSQIEAFNRLHESKNDYDGYDKSNEFDFSLNGFNDISPRGFNNFHGNPGYNFGFNQNPYGIIQYFN